MGKPLENLILSNRNQHVKMIVPGEGTEVCYGHYDMLIGPRYTIAMKRKQAENLCRAEEHVFAPLENWLNEVDEGQHWYSQDDLQVTCTIRMPHVVTFCVYFNRIEMCEEQESERFSPHGLTSRDPVVQETKKLNLT